MGLTEGDPAGKVKAIHTEEEKQIARHCRALLRQTHTQTQSQTR
jgi:acetate kinase